MKKLSNVLAVAGVLALGAVAQAQAPGDPAAPPAMAPAPAGDPGVTVTTETTTGVGASDMTIVGADDVGTLPTTGGAPIAMALVGTLTAAGAFFARRKLS